MSVDRDLVGPVLDWLGVFDPFDLGFLVPKLWCKNPFDLGV